MTIPSDKNQPGRRPVTSQILAATTPPTAAPLKSACAHTRCAEGCREGSPCDSRLLLSNARAQLQASHHKNRSERSERDKSLVSLVSCSATLDSAAQPAPDQETT